MKTIQYLLALLFLLIPRALIESAFVLKSMHKKTFYFSGRVAIYRVAKALRHKSSIAIVPEYTCNVLHRALLEAGYTLKQYSCDANHEPNISQIIVLGRQFPRSILCLAPLYGADGGESWVNTAEGKAWREENSVFLIFDICQDYHRFASSSVGKEGMAALITSFNNKSFPGLMGALVVSDLQDNEYKLPRAQDSIHLLVLAILDNIKIFRDYFVLRPDNSQIKRKYDYSYCVHFPYGLEYSGANKLQLAMGLAGVLMLPFYSLRKSKYLEKKYIAPVRTPNYRTASIVFSEESNPKLVRKLPYAINGDPDRCLNPNI